MEREIFQFPRILLLIVLHVEDFHCKQYMYIPDILLIHTIILFKKLIILFLETHENYVKIRNA